jgi:hypothetical protein
MRGLNAVSTSSIHSWSQALTSTPVRPHHWRIVPATFLVQFEDSHGGLFSILWILVFAFATLNIISLGARRLEPKKTSLNMGEMMAVLVVLFSVFLLGWELLQLYHIFPLHLGSR